MSTVLNRYSWWKYAFLAIVIAVGVIYALPNLFGEDPAVQIGGSDVYQVSAQTLSQAEQILKANNVAYKSIDLARGKIIIRLISLDSQLSTKELLQKQLGDHYTVAVSLTPATPEWLRSLGGKPMKYGLDLRGGVHFLLQVDVNSAIAKHEKSDIRQMAEKMRQAKIRYSGIRPQKPTGLLINFRDAKTRTQAYNLIKRDFVDYQLSTYEQGDVFYLRAGLTPSALAKMRDYTISQTIQVLNSRVNALGVADSVITRQGVDRIAIDLPGLQDTAQASKILGGNATLEMHLVDETADLQNAARGIVPAGDKFYHMINGQPIVLKNQVILTGDAITNASASFDQSGQPSVNIRAAGPQVPEFHRITGENIGKRMAIVLIQLTPETKKVDGKIVQQIKRTETVINAATIQSALPGSFQVTGLVSPQLAQNLAIQLRSGTTPANMYPLQELLIGPSLGKANIDRGLISIAVGFLLIVLFMAAYYRLFGLLANMALALNLILITALMSIVGFTLNLAGIAGILLSLGMAVDANVLIFERIREELRAGTTPQAAIHAGYERAFATIVDANVTTLIVAVILFGIASSNVKGFAITLIIGLMTSMLTAIMGTRAGVNLIYGSRIVKKLSIGI